VWLGTIDSSKNSIDDDGSGAFKDLIAFFEVGDIVDFELLGDLVEDEGEGVFFGVSGVGVHGEQLHVSGAVTREPVVREDGIGGEDSFQIPVFEFVMNHHRHSSLSQPTDGLLEFGNGLDLDPLGVLVDLVHELVVEGGLDVVAEVDWLDHQHRWGQ